MNKKAFKLIFSKAHAMLIAVGETARGYNHNTTTHHSKNTTYQTISQNVQDYQQNKTVKLTTLVLSLWTTLTPILPSLLYSQTVYAQSQIQSYTGGDPNYRPTLLRSDNDIPIVNIRTINDNGVSRNQFGQFDIDEKGVILNNARFATHSQLAGRIDGNQWLLSGEARTIVNEIYSPNPSKLNGKIEIAGQTANVIIANPSGITINGGGFINANNSVLTTGKIDYHQGIPVGIQVNKGTIQIQDQGLSYQFNEKNAPYFAQLLSHTAIVHGKITGGEQTFVQVVTGENAIGLSPTVNSTDIKPQPTTAPINDQQRISIDVGQLGQVYAGGIHIVSTAEGMGVKQAGQLKAHHKIHLQADGKIVNSGNIQTTSEQGQVLIKNTEAGHDIVNTGHIHSKKEVRLVSAHDIQNQTAGTILGEQQTTLLAQNDINFKKLDYQNTYTKLILQAGQDIQSQEHIKIDTTGDINIKAGGLLNLTQAHIQSQQSNQQNNPSTIEIIGQEIILKDSYLANQAGTIDIGAKKLTAEHNTIHSNSYHSAKDQDTNINLIADQLSLTNNEIKTDSTINLASNHDFNNQNNNIQAKTLSIASTANITSQNNSIKTSEQMSVATGHNINLNADQIQVGSLTARSEQGQINITDSQIHSDKHLYLQAKAHQSHNSKLIAKDSVSIHSQDNNSLIDTQIQTNKHLAMSSKTADIVINNQNNETIDASGLISIQAEKDIKLNQSVIQGGAIALHSKNAGVDWQTAQLKTHKNEVLAQDETLKPANGSLTIKSHDDMMIIAGKSIETVGDLELQSDGQLSLQGENGNPNTTKGGRGSEKVVTINSGGAVYLKGKHTDLQGTNITAQGTIQVYALDGDLKLSGVKSDISPLKDEERIHELTLQIYRIDEQINILNTDSQYQSIRKQQATTQEQLNQLEQDYQSLPNPSQAQQQKYKQDKTALTHQLSRLGRELIDRQQTLGIDKDLVQLEQEKNINQKSLKIAQTPFNGFENKGTILNAGSTIRLVASNGIEIEQAHLKTPDFTIIQALGTGKEREIGKDDKTGEILKMPFAIRIEGLTDVYQRGEENDDGFSLHNNYQPTTIQADKGILIQAIGTGEIKPNQSTAVSSPYNILMVGGDYQAKDGTIQIQSLGSTLLQAGQDSIYDRETNTVKKGKIKRKTIITTTTEQIQDADVVKLTAQNIQIQAGDHIYAYGTAFNAQDEKQNKNHVSLQAGDSVRLLAVEEINQKDINIQKISKFLGVKYNKSKNNDSHQVLSELPTKILADITQTQSGANTELQGTRHSQLIRRLENK